jgi:hypothetical protein
MMCTPSSFHRWILFGRNIDDRYGPTFYVPCVIILIGVDPPWWCDSIYIDTDNGIFFFPNIFDNLIKVDNEFTLTTIYEYPSMKRPN